MSSEKYGPESFRYGTLALATDAADKPYQFGDGCLSDQLLGQWFADVVNHR
jgi:hypothetical protein